MKPLVLKSGVLYDVFQSTLSGRFTIIPSCFSMLQNSSTSSIAFFKCCFGKYEPPFFLKKGTVDTLQLACRTKKYFNTNKVKNT